MKIGFIQFDPVFGDIDGNIGKVMELGEPVDADLIVLPEFTQGSGVVKPIGRVFWSLVHQLSSQRLSFGRFQVRQDL